MYVSQHTIPGVAFNIVHEYDLDDKAKEPTPNDPRRKYTVNEPRVEHRAEYDGPLRRIEIPESRWSTILDPSHTCAHKSAQSKSEPHPATFKVRVTAKLSIQHDDHLAHEAQNYQKFADILFEHWTGYNVVPPLHDPTPVGAVVPQFYGYYEAVNEKGEKIKADKRGRYLSPILLLEDCGKPIVVEKLSIDDRYVLSFLFFFLDLLISRGLVNAVSCFCVFDFYQTRMCRPLISSALRRLDTQLLLPPQYSHATRRYRRLAYHEDEQEQTRPPLSVDRLWESNGRKDEG